MASVNLKKEQIRTGRIIGTNHMDIEDARDYLELDNADDFDFER